MQQRNLEIYLGTYAQQNGADAAAALVAGGFRKASEFPYSGLSPDKRQYADENFSAFERYIWRPQGINEAIYNEAIIKSGLQIWRSEDLLPTAMRQRHDFALLDAQIASPLASGAYLFGTAVGLSDDDRYALTMTAGNIALIAGAVAAGKTGLLPVTGSLGIKSGTDRRQVRGSTRTRNLGAAGDLASGTETPVNTNFAGGVAPPLNVVVGQQNKHIIGTNGYKTAGQVTQRSTLEPGLDVQGIVNRYAGTGQAANGVPLGQPGSTERIKTNSVIGVFYDSNGVGSPTTNFTIRYSKSGVHIVPARP